MNDLEQEQIQAPQNTKSTSLTISVVVTVILVVGIVFFWLWSNSSVDRSALSEEVIDLSRDAGDIVYDYGLDAASATVEQVGGVLALSMVPADADATHQPKFYSLDVSNPAAPFVTNNRSATRVSVASEFPDKNDATQYYALTSSQATDDFADNTRIHLIDTAAKSTTLIQTTPGDRERHLDWSPASQLLAYASLANTDFENTPRASDFEIRLLDPVTQEEQVVAEGAFPMWDDLGEQILYVKNDGLYRYRLDVDSSERVIETLGDGDGTIATSAKFDLSPDGRYLAWTTPQRNLIAMYAINSWEPFEMVEIGRMQTAGTEYYWPVFSPNGEFYAVQAIDEVADGSRANARIEIRAIQGRDVLRSYSIAEFDFMRAFIDDWIN